MMNTATPRCASVMPTKLRGSARNPFTTPGLPRTRVTSPWTVFAIVQRAMASAASSSSE